MHIRTHFLFVIAMVTISFFELGRPLVGAELIGGKKLGLTVNSRVAISDRACPITGGIPFPRGGLSTEDRIRVFDSSDTELPVQTEVLATWDTDGRQVRWLLVDFQAAGLKLGRNQFQLRYGPGAPSGETVASVDPRESSWPPNKIIESLYMVDQDGRRYGAAVGDDETLIETETAGPLRTVVRVHLYHKDRDGKRLCRAILRLHYYAGIDHVRVLHSVVMDADPEQVKIRGMRLKLAGFDGTAQTLTFEPGEFRVLVGRPSR
ncbi:MAG: hypothetical protein H8E44_39620 [Planctomycetes bacterium]|nr:hypothetical protein [Planctomycetota bacterium]